VTGSEKNQEGTSWWYISDRE